MEKDKRVSRARQFIRELAEETDPPELNVDFVDDLYTLVLLSGSIGCDTSSVKGFQLLTDNDTTRLLRELLH